MQRRRNSHIEGLATHDDPESCGHARKDVPEALTGAHVGWVLSLEKEFQFQVPRWFRIPKATPDTPPVGEVWRDLAWSKTPSMRGSTLYENRETLRPSTERWNRGPRWEVRGLKPSMNGAGSLTAP